MTDSTPQNGKAVSLTPDSPVTQSAFLAQPATCGEVLGFINQISPVLQVVPYHALVISLLMEKLGITEQEVEAHRLAKLAEIQAEQAQQKAAAEIQSMHDGGIA